MYKDLTWNNCVPFIPVRPGYYTGDCYHFITACIEKQELGFSKQAMCAPEKVMISNSNRIPQSPCTNLLCNSYMALLCPVRVHGNLGEERTFKWTHSYNLLFVTLGPLSTVITAIVVLRAIYKGSQHVAKTICCQMTGGRSSPCMLGSCVPIRSTGTASRSNGLTDKLYIQRVVYKSSSSSCPSLFGRNRVGYEPLTSNEGDFL